jgi:hypothetical protein
MEGGNGLALQARCWEEKSLAKINDYVVNQDDVRLVQLLA